MEIDYKALIEQILISQTGDPKMIALFTTARKYGLDMLNAMAFLMEIGEIFKDES